jgi:Protein of unknown function (DUF1045)
MPRFAVYFVPKAGDSLYEFGTQILGYDVRARRSAQMPPSLEQELGKIEDSWVEHARPFGVHVTICDALDCDFATIPDVEARLLDLFDCFDRLYQSAWPGNRLFAGLDHGARTFDEPQRRKLRLFSSHTVLDSWKPHFTLLDPFSGTNPEAMASALARLTEEYQELTVDSVCLLVQEHEGANWFIYREFSRAGKPQLLT